MPSRAGGSGLPQLPGWPSQKAPNEIPSKAKARRSTCHPHSVRCSSCPPPPALPATRENVRRSLRLMGRFVACFPNQKIFTQILGPLVFLGLRTMSPPSRAAVLGTNPTQPSGLGHAGCFCCSPWSSLCCTPGQARTPYGTRPFVRSRSHEGRRCFACACTVLKVRFKIPPEATPTAPLFFSVLDVH